MGAISRKALSALLAVTLAVGSLPASAFAEMAEESMGESPSAQSAASGSSTGGVSANEQRQSASVDPQAQPQAPASEGEMATEDPKPPASDAPDENALKTDANALTPEATPAPAQDAPELTAESDTAEDALGQQLSVQAVNASRYTYQARPLMSPINYVIYVQTDNPDPTSFRLKDKSSRYGVPGDEDGAFLAVTDTFLDVAYENVTTHRVRGGYIFEDRTVRSDGGQLSVQAKSGNTYVDTGRTVQLPALKDAVDYLVENCTNTSAGFFERLDAVASYLDRYSIYPTPVFDTSKPNRETPYPFLATSPYWELGLNEHFEMYERGEARMLLQKVYPLVLDSLGYPSVIATAAGRLNKNCTVAQGDMHAAVNVTLNGTTRYYYGAGTGGRDPVHSSDIAKSYRFDKSSGDASVESFTAAHDRLMAYKTKATGKMASYRDQIQGETFRKTIGRGSWIRVASEGGFSYGTRFAFVAGTPDGKDYYIASDAWVDGRYVDQFEGFAPGEKFSDHPHADIVRRNVTYTDLGGVRRIADVMYRYDAQANTWYAYSAYLGDGYYAQPQDYPDELSLTEAEVRALVPDRNTRVPIDQMLIYDGTAAPGTRHGTVRVTSIQMEKTKDVPIGSTAWIEVKVLPDNADFKQYELTSSDPSIVSVRDECVVGHKVGTATITATSMDGGKKASCRVTVTGAASRFSDVPANAWYTDVVGRAAGLGLINGYADGRFGPADKVTRGQVAVILWNMAGQPAAGSGARTFPDVASNQYFYNAVRWASSMGVVSGYQNGRFGPDDPVTREQFAVMLANYAKNVARRQVAGSASDYGKMKDRAMVSGWAQASVGWCFRSKILSGTKDGRVNPKGSATRAEAAKMVVYLHDLLG